MSHLSLVPMLYDHCLTAGIDPVHAGSALSLYSFVVQHPTLHSAILREPYAPWYPRSLLGGDRTIPHPVAPHFLVRSDALRVPFAVRTLVLSLSPNYVKTERAFVDTSWRSKPWAIVLTFAHDLPFCVCSLCLYPLSFGSGWVDNETDKPFCGACRDILTSNLRECWYENQDQCLELSQVAG